MTITALLSNDCRSRRLRRLSLGAVLLILAVGVVGYLGWRRARADFEHRQALAALERGDWSAAGDHLARRLDAWPADREALMLALRTARRADRPREAAELQARYHSAYGDSSDLALERILFALQQGLRPELERSAQRMVADNHPESPLLLEALAQSFLKSGRASEVFQTADALLRRQPDHPQAWRWRGWAREQLNRNEEAAQDYAKAVELRPEDAAARLALGLLLLDFLRYPEALEQFRWLHQRQPEDPEIGLGLARCWRGIGAVDEARVLLDELVSRYPGEGLILSERGQLALEEGRAVEAERWLRAAARLVPFDRSTHFALYTGLQLRGQSDEAQVHLRAYERLQVDHQRLQALEREMPRSGPAPGLRYEAGLLCQQLGRTAEAERYFRAALQDDPSHGPARRALAGLRSKLSDLQQPTKQAQSPADMP